MCTFLNLNDVAFFSTLIRHQWTVSFVSFIKYDRFKFWNLSLHRLYSIVFCPDIKLDLIEWKISGKSGIILWTSFSASYFQFWKLIIISYYCLRFVGIDEYSQGFSCKKFSLSIYMWLVRNPEISSYT